MTSGKRSRRHFGQQLHGRLCVLRRSATAFLAFRGQSETGLEEAWSILEKRWVEWHQALRTESLAALCSSVQARFMLEMRELQGTLLSLENGQADNHLWTWTSKCLQRCVLSFGMRALWSRRGFWCHTGCKSRRRQNLQQSVNMLNARMKLRKALAWLQQQPSAMSVADRQSATEDMSAADCASCT